MTEELENLDELIELVRELKNWELVNDVQFRNGSPDSLKRLQNLISYKILTNEEYGFKYMNNDFVILFLKRSPNIDSDRADLQKVGWLKKLWSKIT